MPEHDSATEPLPVDPEARREMWAAISLLQQANDRRPVVDAMRALADAEGAPDVDREAFEEVLGRPVDEQVRIVAGSRLHAAGRLDVLRQLAISDLEPETLRPLAGSLIAPTAGGGDAQRLIEAVSRHPVGDPLGRSDVPPRIAVDEEPQPPPEPHPMPEPGPEPHPMPDPGSESESTESFALVAEARDTILASTCIARSAKVGGQVALEVWDTMLTVADLSSFRVVVDPMQWDDCPLSRTFFRQMRSLGPLDQPLAPPDGDPQHPPWSDRVEETVDFSFGFGLVEMRTALAMRFWDNSAQADDERRCIGSTYSLLPGGDGRIVVDQGFLLAEQLSGGRVRIRTLKQVRFASMTPAVDLACAVWKYAGPLMWTSCR